MTESQALELIGQQFATQWPTLSAAVAGGPFPFAMFDQALPSADTFALMTVVHTVRNQITQGKPSRKLARCNIFVKIWTPAGSGNVKLASDLSGVARAIYETSSLGSVPGDALTVLAGTTQEAGLDGRWSMRAVVFDAWYSEQS